MTGTPLPGGHPPLPEPLGVPAVDSHCHLDLAAGDAALPVGQALAAAHAVGVTRVVQIGCDVDSARWSVDVAQQQPAVVAGVALHPNEAPRIAARAGRDALAAAWAEIDRLAAHPRVRAIGETGLDHFRTGPDGREVQEESFRRHIALAKAHDKALVIHDRDAHDDVVRVLLDEGPPERVVFHCFSGGPELARTCVDHGWVVSFAGTVTFKNAEPLRAALAVVPLELLLVETDAPYLAPVPFRGRPNGSYLVPLTLRAMAAVKGVDADTLAAATTTVSDRIFGGW
ncbi:MAG: TatD family hydrolase [Actinomycetia bacterium]|jgi:TatD DNase family protein|nr:TatD family hydrolase [Actinomycetes bacterium]